METTRAICCCIILLCRASVVTTVYSWCCGVTGSECVGTYVSLAGTYDCKAASRSLVSVVVAVIASGSILSLLDAFHEQTTSDKFSVDTCGQVCLPGWYYRTHSMREGNPDATQRFHAEANSSVASTISPYPP